MKISLLNNFFKSEINILIMNYTIKLINFMKNPFSNKLEMKTPIY